MNVSSNWRYRCVMASRNSGAVQFARRRSLHGPMRLHQDTGELVLDLPVGLGWALAGAPSRASRRSQVNSVAAVSAACQALFIASEVERQS